MNIRNLDTSISLKTVAVSLVATCLFIVVAVAYSDSGRAAEETPVLKFLVANADGDSHQRLMGIQAIVVGPSGSQIVGETDDWGVVVVEKEILKRADGGAILFCSQGFFCGAFLIDSDLLRYDEKYIRLAVVAVL